MKRTLFALSALLTASHASAQPAPQAAPYAAPGPTPAYGGSPYAPPVYGPAPYYAPQPVPVVPIWLMSDARGPTYELRHPGNESKIFFCRSQLCVAYLPIGEYEVYVPPTPDYAEGKRRVKIEKPTQLKIEPRDASAQTTGLAMGVGGTVLALAGFTALVVASNRNCGDASCVDQRDTMVWLGLGGLIVGAILTPIGWVRFGKSFRPGVQVIEKP